MSQGYADANLFLNTGSYSVYENLRFNTTDFTTAPSNLSTTSTGDYNFRHAKIGITPDADLLAVPSTSTFGDLSGSTVGISQTSGNLISVAPPTDTTSFASLVTADVGSGDVDFQIWNGGDTALTPYTAADNTFDPGILDGAISFTDSSIDLGQMSVLPEGTVTTDVFFPADVDAGEAVAGTKGLKSADDVKGGKLASAKGAQQTLFDLLKDASDGLGFVTSISMTVDDLLKTFGINLPMLAGKTLTVSFIHRPGEPVTLVINRSIEQGEVPGGKASLRHVTVFTLENGEWLRREGLGALFVGKVPMPGNTPPLPYAVSAHISSEITGDETNGKQVAAVFSVTLSSFWLSGRIADMVAAGSTALGFPNVAAGAAGYSQFTTKVNGFGFDAKGGLSVAAKVDIADRDGDGILEIQSITFKGKTYSVEEFDKVIEATVREAYSRINPEITYAVPSTDFGSTSYVQPFRGGSASALFTGNIQDLAQSNPNALKNEATWETLPALGIFGPGIAADMFTALTANGQSPTEASNAIVGAINQANGDSGQAVSNILSLGYGDGNINGDYRYRTMAQTAAAGPVHQSILASEPSHFRSEDSWSFLGADAVQAQAAAASIFTTLTDRGWTPQGAYDFAIDNWTNGGANQLQEALQVVDNLPPLPSSQGTGLGF